MSRYKKIALLVAAIFLIACSEEVKRVASATKEVTVLTKIFVMPGLKRERTLRIYLPPDYAKAKESYPVLYMHDGQNLFDDVTSYVGEWGIDESLNELSESDSFNLIVVGIDNGQEKRMNELSPWPNSSFGEAEGEQYMEFIVNTVKPYIDRHYRTMPEVENTGIMGSSMGGLISHYAVIQYPGIFSKAGIFSPSYWYSEEVNKFTATYASPGKNKLYLLMGGAEGDDLVEDFVEMVSRLKVIGFDNKNLSSKITPKAEHNETFWRSEFKQAVVWLFTENKSIEK